ncbi:hypothetical protein EXIGLDRAFT_694276 [Exidia glandulosa HHB12029]|uniref:DUF6697 domain-containing protein n=1 Tax=Exidia glandulosa HHB12029 TaxID=1314781 RepID=A0A165GPE7_EXIGL|nr:hypothetical protein EXIGLDRAFT_694276 [Exidia glandulosa HHB12029]
MLARSLAEYVGRVRQFEELARAACAERDELAVCYTQRVTRAEKGMEDALREVDALRAWKGSRQTSPGSDEMSVTEDDIADKTVNGLELVKFVVQEEEVPRGALLTPNLTPVVESALPDVDEKVMFGANVKTKTSAAGFADRVAVLSRLPVPRNIPRADPPPLQLPTRHTFAEIFGHSNGNRMTQISLSGHHVLHDATTVWPHGESNVHGWLFTPVFRCFSLQVAGTFKWVEMDVTGQLEKPTECFFSMKWQDGNWYYAGIYKGFRMREVSPEEWKEFPAERKNAIIAETLRERRAVAPQLQLDVRQMYELGILRVACIGLQCTGYNQRLCETVYRHAEKCRRTGQWKGVPFD